MQWYIQCSASVNSVHEVDLDVLDLGVGYAIVGWYGSRNRVLDV